MVVNILDKIKLANLVGRGGANYPVALKWQAVKEATKNQKARSVFVVINGSEGEPEVVKDGYILANYPERIIDGLRLAGDFLGATKTYIFLRPDYYRKYGRRLKKEINKVKTLKDKVILFSKPEEAGYIGGEESAILNILEGKKAEPRLKPPYPTAKGLFGAPTLINNVETFYNVSLVDRNEYYDLRFYSVGGAASRHGVFSYPAKWTVRRVLEESGNWPNFPFFIQVGGAAAGEVLNSEQLDKVVSGCGSIIVYNLAEHNPKELMTSWLKFFCRNSCGQCTPCREGSYRLLEMMKNGTLDQKFVALLSETLEQSSFCSLGATLPVPLNSYLKNIASRLNFEK